jgi:hypothetical protein
MVIADVFIFSLGLTVYTVYRFYKYILKETFC